MTICLEFFLQFGFVSVCFVLLVYSSFVDFLGTLKDPPQDGHFERLIKSKVQSLSFPIKRQANNGETQIGHLGQIDHLISSLSQRRKKKTKKKCLLERRIIGKS